MRRIVKTSLNSCLYVERHMTGTLEEVWFLYLNKKQTQPTITVRKYFDTLISFGEKNKATSVLTRHNVPQVQKHPEIASQRF